MDQVLPVVGRTMLGGVLVLLFAVLGAICFARVATPLVFGICALGWAAADIGSLLLACRLGAGADEPT